eukprot:EG_transcript_11383
MELPPHELFNMLNNLFPVLCLDCRPAPAFAASHLKDARSAPDCLAEGGGADFQRVLEGCVAAWLTPRAKAFVVLLVQEGDRAAVARACRALPTAGDGRWQSPPEDAVGVPSATPSVWQSILDVRFLCFDAFLLKYHLCSALFVRDPPDTPVKGGARLPYATEVLPDFLFLGDFDHGSNPHHLRSLRITHVIDASGSRLAQEAATALGLAYLPVDLWDTEDADIAAVFPRTNDFLAAARATDGARCLVHCRAGISRSPSLVLAYLLHSWAREPTDGLPSDLRGAVEWVLRQRPIACPNVAFRDQLRRYEAELLGHSSLADDYEFLALIEAHNQLWCTHLGAETDYDRLPITAALARNKGSATVADFLAGLVGCVPCAADLDAVEPAVRRPFLKKGSGVGRRGQKP